MLAKDLAGNALIVGQGHDHPWLYSDGLVTEMPRWIAGAAPAMPLRCEAQVRYRQRPFGCIVETGADGALRVRFDSPQRAVTPGQSAVFYDGDRCLGGAVIRAAREGVDTPAPRADAVAAS